MDIPELENATWALAAVIATQREAAQSSLADALAADPERTAVLEAVGLLRRTGTDAALHDGPLAANAAAARLSSLRQALDVATGELPRGWDAQSDEVLLDQGQASAATGHAIAQRIVPTLSGLADRLDSPGSRVLDVGTGVGALATALAEDLPQVRVTAIDVLERAVRRARGQLEKAGPVANRVELRQQDVGDLREPRAYDLIWLPAPFLSARCLEASLPHIVNAIAFGGWLVVGTNPAPPGPLATAVARWNATRNGGNAFDANSMAARLGALGLDGVDQRPTVPGGPTMVIGQRPAQLGAGSMKTAVP